MGVKIFFTPRRHHTKLIYETIRDYRKDHPRLIDKIEQDSITSIAHRITQLDKEKNDLSDMAERLRKLDKDKRGH